MTPPQGRWVSVCRWRWPDSSWSFAGPVAELDPIERDTIEGDTIGYDMVS